MTQCGTRTPIGSSSGLVPVSHRQVWHRWAGEERAVLATKVMGRMLPG